MRTRWPRRVAVSLGALACALAWQAPSSTGEAPSGCEGAQSPFDGLGTWVDIYDPALWRAPEKAVAGMAAHGVRTLYLQTASDEDGPSVFRPDRTGRFLAAAHGRGMCVVAWYLAPLKSQPRELTRALAATRFTASTAQQFDGFGLDIETTASTPSGPARNRNLLGLSRSLRRAMGSTYPLAAITPSPFGMKLRPRYWPGFPYRSLYGIYDTFMPMGYYTYHQKTAAGAYTETRQNLRILRAAVADEQVPVHLVGGIASDSSAAETRAFRRAILDDGGVLGVSLYDYATTGREDWAALDAIF